MEDTPILSVTQLLSSLQMLLDATNTRKQKIFGEIGSFKQYPSGHCYFSLKDNDSMIQAVLFKTQLMELETRNQADISSLLHEGTTVEIDAELNVYKPRGQLQIICKNIRPIGQGSILKLLEARKKKFASLGYFDESRKKTIPTFCRRVGIVTSRETAALQDILKTFSESRIPPKLYIFDTPVQGQGAGVKIARQIANANTYPLDCILLCRGGGAPEDILCFSDEVVLNAIYDSDIPLVSGVGHQIDIPLSDLVADIRVATPTAAAKLIVDLLSNALHTFNDRVAEMASLGQQFVRNTKLYLQNLNPKNTIHTLLQAIKNKKQFLDHIQDGLKQSLSTRITRAKTDLNLMYSYLQETEPRRVLEKGYALVYDSSKTRLITRQADIAKLDNLPATEPKKMIVEFWDGDLEVFRDSK